MHKGHGDDIMAYSDIRLNFSSNVYQHLLHEDLFCYLADRIDDVAFYPEPRPERLETMLAPLLRLSSDEVCVTAGATEAIYVIAQTFRRSRTAVLQPTFAEYRDACQLHEHTLCDIFSLEQIPERAQMVWICNPNNPTGHAEDAGCILDIVDRHPDKLFIIDQSYADYTIKPMLTPRQAADRANVILLYSLTKRYAIPGLRLGYMVANSGLISQLRVQLMPWTVNQVALSAADYLLAHDDEFFLPVAQLNTERERVGRALETMGCVDVWPSDCHILLSRLRIGKASALKDYLAREHGILIRDASNFRGLDEGFFRIAVQTSEEDDELLTAIQQWIAL